MFAQDGLEIQVRNDWRGGGVGSSLSETPSQPSVLNDSFEKLRGLPDKSARNAREISYAFVSQKRSKISVPFAFYYF